MTTPPSYTEGAAGGPTSAITDSVLYNTAAGGSDYEIHGPFLFGWGRITRADFNPNDGTYSGYPNNLFVANKSRVDTQYNGNMPFWVGFESDAPEWEFYVKGTGGQFQLLVDEEDGNGWQTALAWQDGPPSDGSLRYCLVSFGSRAHRRYVLRLSNSIFGGINVGPTDTIVPLTSMRGLRAIVFGDSFTEGVNLSSSLQNYVYYMGEYLGWDPLASGSGGTGYVNDGGGTKRKLFDRLEDDLFGLVQPPEFILVTMGLNDSQSVYYADLATECDRSFTKMREAGVPILVSGPLYTASPPAGLAEASSIIQARALAAGLPFADQVNDVLYGKRGNVIRAGSSTAPFRGNGNVNNPTGNGNADYTRGPADGTHPSKYGQKALGRWFGGAVMTYIEHGELF